LLSPSESEQKQQSIEPKEQQQTDQDDGPEMGADITPLDAGMMKHLVLKYFESTRSGSPESQRDMLVLLANLLDMDDHDREVLGLLVLNPTQRRQQQQQQQQVTGSRSMLSRILWGGSPEAGKASKASESSDLGRVNWEEAVNEKPFADLFQQVVGEELR
jgi:hypothetical protein